MKKIVSLMMASMIFLSLSSFTVSASEYEVEEYPVSIEEQEELEIYYPRTYWSEIQSIVHGIVPRGNSLSYSASCTSYNKNNTVYVSISLQKFVNGSWQTISTASSSGKLVAGASKVVSVTSGLYRSCTNVTIYNQNGVRVESATNVYSDPKNI